MEEIIQAQGGIFKELREWYKKYVNVPIISRFLKLFLRTTTDVLARVKKFSFPEKYDWDWKLEMLLGKYEASTTKLFKKNVKPGMVIIDIGAHVGYFTKLFSKLAGKNGKIYAFEADSENFSLLKENASSLKNAQIFNKIISDKTGFMPLFKINNCSGGHSIIENPGTYKTADIPSITIDDFAAEKNIGSVDVIKMDIEGAEPLAFSGMGKTIEKSKNLKILMEFNPKALESGNVIPMEFLEECSRNFVFFQIADNGDLEKLDIKNVGTIRHYLGKNEFTNLFLVRKNEN